VIAATHTVSEADGKRKYQSRAAPEPLPTFDPPARTRTYLLRTAVRRDPPRSSRPPPAIRSNYLHGRSYVEAIRPVGSPRTLDVRLRVGVR
jgi:hypothetical protein